MHLFVFLRFLLFIKGNLAELSIKNIYNPEEKNNTKIKGIIISKELPKRHGGNEENF